MKKLSKKDIKLIKESLLVAIENYEYEKEVSFDHEVKELKILNEKISNAKDLFNRL